MYCCPDLLCKNFLGVEDAEEGDFCGLCGEELIEMELLGGFEIDSTHKCQTGRQMLLDSFKDDPLEMGGDDSVSDFSSDGDGFVATMGTANLSKSGGRRSSKTYNRRKKHGSEFRVQSRMDGTPRSPKGSRMFPRVDNIVHSNEELQAISLENDARAIHKQYTLSSLERAGATTIVCAIVAHRDGTLRKFVFSNSPGHDKTGRIYAEKLGYHVISTDQAHAEVGMLVYCMSRKDLANLPFRFGCDKYHCQECAKIMTDAYGEGVIFTDTYVSDLVFQHYYMTKEYQELLDYEERPAAGRKIIGAKKDRTVLDDFGDPGISNKKSVKSVRGGRLREPLIEPTQPDYEPKKKKGKSAKKAAKPKKPTHKKKKKKKLWF